MRIHTLVISEWDANLQRYVTTYEEGYDYQGPVALSCGATQGQKDVANQQGDLFKTLQGQASSIFGADNAIFSKLMGSFAPIVAAGPNQNGFSNSEDQNLRSQAITNNGTGFRNANTAVKEANAAVGGGNIALPSGAAIGRNLSTANAAAANTANDLSNIELKNQEQGRENFFGAANVLGGAGNVFNSATSAAGAATGAGQAAQEGQDQIAAAANSPWDAAIGAAGSVLGGAATGYFGGLGGKKGGGKG